VQRRHFTAITGDDDGALVRNEVRPFEVLGALEQEVITTQLDALARRHAQVTLGAVVARQHHAQGTHRQAQVRQLHAPVAAGQATHTLGQALVAGLVDDVAQPAQHHPGRQGEGAQDRPVEIVDDQASDRRQHRAADQHRGHHVRQPFAGGVLPAHHHTHAQHAHQQRHQRQEQGIEVRWADRQLGTGQGIEHQRIQGAQQDHRSGHHQDQVVGQQQRLARPQGKADLALDHRGAQGEQGQRATDHEQQEDQDEHATRRVGSERMHRGQHPGTHQEGPQQAQRERSNRQQHGPALEHPAFFRHRQRVDQRGTHQPGHERGVLHRVPEPPATPAQFVIGPPRTQGDTHAQEGPGDDGPGPRPARPGCVQPPAEQRGNGKGEGHREAHITHVQHRRVDDQAEVLQQRVEVTAIGRHLRQQALERVGSDDQEAQETDADHAHNRQHAGQHHLRQLPRED